jgi:hypothetical protein
LALIIWAPFVNYFQYKLEKESFPILLAVIVASVAYAAFFSGYVKNFSIDPNDIKKIKFFTDGLIASSLSLLIGLLVINSGLDFKILNWLIAFVIVIIIMLTMFFSSFCLVKSWYFMTKNLFKRN